MNTGSVLFDGLLMTAGPVMVTERVRQAGSRAMTNPDTDKAFSHFYEDLCRRVSLLLGTQNKTYILDGEGMLGLDSAVCSLTEPGDRALVIDNGVFGRGFEPMLRAGGAYPVVWSFDRTEPVRPEEFAKRLKADHDFTCAYMVHCDTPSGVLNPVSELCTLLDEYGIISVVDSVAGFPGEPVDTEHIDVLLGGSQKCWSAPSGLSVVTVSERAAAKMKNRKKPIASFYSSLPIFMEYRERDYFSYTMPADRIYAFEAAVSAVEEEGLEAFQERHSACAAFTRERLLSMGLKLYLNRGFSSTVTAFRSPCDDEKLIKYMIDAYGVYISDSVDEYKGQLLRIGHMGENAHMNHVRTALDALEAALRHFA